MQGFSICHLTNQAHYRTEKLLLAIPELFPLLSTERTETLTVRCLIREETLNDQLNVPFALFQRELPLKRYSTLETATSSLAVPLIVKPALTIAFFFGEEILTFGLFVSIDGVLSGKGVGVIALGLSTAR